MSLKKYFLFLYLNIQWLDINIFNDEVLVWQLTWIEEDNGLETRELRVVDLHLVQRLNELLHDAQPDFAEVQVLIAALCGQRYDWQTRLNRS